MKDCCHVKMHVLDDQIYLAKGRLFFFFKRAIGIPSQMYLGKSFFQGFYSSSQGHTCYFNWDMHRQSSASCGTKRAVLILDWRDGILGSYIRTEYHYVFCQNFLGMLIIVILVLFDSIWQQIFFLVFRLGSFRWPDSSNLWPLYYLW